MMNPTAGHKSRLVTLAASMRLVSLLLALGMSGMILANPRAFADTSHVMLMLVMLGVCAGFVHGVGFVPRAAVWRIAFSPWLSWPLMGLGLWLMLANWA